MTATAGSRGFRGMLIPHDQVRHACWFPNETSQTQMLLAVQCALLQDIRSLLNVLVSEKPAD